MMRFTNIALLALLLAVTLSLPAAAGNLVFPKDGAAAKDAIAADCPSCIADGVTLCGTTDVQFGKRFSRAFFAGKPKRGYLPGFGLSGEAFRALARGTAYDALMQSLRQRFESLPLVIIDGGFAATRTLPKPAAVDVAFPTELHQCVRDAAKPWGCCVAADCKSECCEKSLGSPAVAVRWDDATSGDTVTLHYSHTLGASTLTRATSAGKTYVYWCIVEEPGRVQ